MHSYTPFLWFNDNAEEASEFYMSIFPGASVKGVQRYGPGSMKPEGQVMTLSLELGGTVYTLLNGGTHYQLNPSFSILVQCDTQEEADVLWDTIVDGGNPLQCGWITDKFGMTWQIVPKELFRLMSLPDREAAQRVMTAMFAMQKISISELERAAAGE